MVETVHSSNSLNNSNISRENINNGEEGGDYKIIEKWMEQEVNVGKTLIQMEAKVIKLLKKKPTTE